MPPARISLTLEETDRMSATFRELVRTVMCFSSSSWAMHQSVVEASRKMESPV